MTPTIIASELVDGVLGGATSIDPESVLSARVDGKYTRIEFFGGRVAVCDVPLAMVLAHAESAQSG